MPAKMTPEGDNFSLLCPTDTRLAVHANKLTDALTQTVRAQLPDTPDEVIETACIALVRQRFAPQ